MSVLRWGFVRYARRGGETAHLAELGRIQSPAAINDEQLRDLGSLLWASNDSDDSRDVDQLW